MTSALQVFRTSLDGGASELFAVGKIHDLVRIAVEEARASRSVVSSSIRGGSGSVPHPVLRPKRNRTAQLEGDPQMKIRSTLWLVALALGLSSRAQAAEVKLLNVSFGFTKAFYAEYNRWFAEKWRRETGDSVVIDAVARPFWNADEAVLQGKLSPDIITLARPGDIDTIAKKTRLVSIDWRKAFPNGSSPYSSAVVFLVRPGNPKGIKDFADLARSDRSIVTSNPKSCGGGSWNYVAAFGFGASEGSSPRQKQDYLAAFLKNVPVVYANQGEAGEAFFKTGAGDVLLTYESFALTSTEKPDAQVELVVPKRTVEIELPVALARANTDQRGTTKVAEAYLKGLYEPQIQELFAKHHFRPRLKVVADQSAGRFPNVEIVRAEAISVQKQSASTSPTAASTTSCRPSRRQSADVATSSSHASGSEGNERRRRPS